MPLIKCEVNFFFNLVCRIIIVTGTVENQTSRFTLTDTKHYAPVVTLSGQDDVKLLQQLKTGFKRTINLNKYQSEPILQVDINRY